MSEYCCFKIEPISVILIGKPYFMFWFKSYLCICVNLKSFSYVSYLLFERKINVFQSIFLWWNIFLSELASQNYIFSIVFELRMNEFFILICFLSFECVRILFHARFSVSELILVCVDSDFNTFVRECFEFEKKRKTKLSEKMWLHGLFCFPHESLHIYVIVLSVIQRFFWIFLCLSQIFCYIKVNERFLPNISRTFCFIKLVCNRKSLISCVSSVYVFIWKSNRLWLIECDWCILTF